jgi:acetyl esterase/lipase
MSGFSLGRLVTLLREHASSPGAPIEVQRSEHERAVAKAPVADGVTLLRVDTDGGPVEWLLPPGPVRSEVLLWFHGGGYGIGSCATSRGMVSTLAALTGARGATLEYRLAPENPFPAAFEDAKAAYRWLLAQGLEPEQVIVGGDSAGGGLALAALAGLRDAGDPMPAGALCFSPWVDLSLSAPSLVANAATDPQVTRAALAGMAARYLGGTDPCSPYVSPLFGDLGGLPPLLIQVGTAEVLLDDSVRLAHAAMEAGCEVVLEQWPGMIHVWQAFAPGLAEGTAALERSARWLTERWER